MRNNNDKERKDKCRTFILGLQRITTAVTTVFEGNENAQSTLPSAATISARYLMSLFFMDKVAWAVGKMAHFDTITIAEDMAIGVVFLNLVLEVVETTAEFIATLITPLLYGCAHGPTQTLNARGLANFALSAYCISNTVALFLYPGIGIYVWVMNNKNMGTLVLLSCVRTFQYSILNQIGDASLELSRPHWLKVFSGLSFVTPGINSKCAMRAKSSADTISSHVTFISLTWLPILFVPYFVAQKSNYARICWSALLALINTILSFSYMWRKQFISQGIQDEIVEDGNSRVLIPLWKLKGYEISIIVMVVSVKAVLAQAIGAIRVVVLLELTSISTIMVGGFALAAPFSAFIYLYSKVRKQRNKALRRKIGNDFHGEFYNGQSLIEQMKEIDGLHFQKHTRKKKVFPNCVDASEVSKWLIRKKKASSEESAKLEIHELVKHGLLLISFKNGDDLLYRLNNVDVRTPYSERLRLWVLLIFMISISLGASSILLLQTGELVLIFAVLTLLPSIASQQMFDIDFDAFMLEYEMNHHDEVTSMQFYAMVLSVVINGPLLATNFFTLSKFRDSESEQQQIKTTQSQAAIVLITALLIFLGLGIYYGFIDRCIVPKRMSISKTFSASQELDKNPSTEEKKICDDVVIGV